MCVIVCSKTGATPPEVDIVEMDEHNPDGMGIAWLDSNKAVWLEKSIKLSRMLDLLRMVKNRHFSYIAHFRIATVGGVHATLCQPFPVTNKQKQLFMCRGNANGYVLAHNGHWGNWSKDEALPMIRREPWSDSAAMAFVAAKTGVIWIPPGNRVATLHHEAGLELLKTSNSGDWVERDGYYLSNLFWERSRAVQGRAGVWTDNVYRHYRPSQRHSSDSLSSSKYYRNGKPTENRYPCEHGRYLRCDSCLPTENGLPIEVLPKQAEASGASFTHNNNGLLLGAEEHGCQHPGAASNGHWHCGECNKKPCVEARKRLTKERQSHEKANVRNDAELASPTTAPALPANGTSPNCETPAFCATTSQYECEACHNYRNDIQRGNGMCKHGLKTFCLDCDGEELRRLAKSYGYPNGTLRRN